jgi:pumilio homology domain family member 6
MGKHHGGSSNAGKKGKGGGKPSTVVTKAVSSKSSKASTDKPAMQSLGDALVHKKGYSPGAKGKGKTNKKDYKKGWEKGAKKYASDKKENNSDANFKSHGKPKTKAPPKTEKEIRMDRKAAKPNFELVESIKTSWNKVRVKSTPDSEKKALLMKMAEQMAGHVQQVTLRHDASRMTQCLLQFGNATQRQAVLTELLEKAVEISKTPYGHFAILKAISYCTGADDQKRICASLKGHFVTLGTNVIGARTVESVCTLYPNKFSRPLRAEFYGHKFTVLLDAPPASLDELLQLQSSKKEAILDHVRDLVQKFVDKGLLEFKYVHDLLWEYTKAVQDDAKRMEDLIQQLADSAPKLITTKPGARAICQVITYSGAKDRKRVIKVCPLSLPAYFCYTYTGR